MPPDFADAALLAWTSVVSGQSGAKVRLSQSTEYYPGTEDRVLIVEGSQESITSAISKALRLMLEVRRPCRVRVVLLQPVVYSSSLRDCRTQPFLMPHCERRRFGVWCRCLPEVRVARVELAVAFVVFVIVAAALDAWVVGWSLSAGAIIGKAGAVVKQLNDDTGARTSVSPLDAVSSVTSERIVSISGNLAAIEAVFQRLVQLSYRDPEQWSWSNRSSRSTVGCGVGGWVGGWVFVSCTWWTCVTTLSTTLALRRYTYDRAPSRGMALAAATGTYGMVPSMYGAPVPSMMPGGPMPYGAPSGGGGRGGMPPSAAPSYGRPSYAPPAPAPPPSYGMPPAPAYYGPSFAAGTLSLLERFERKLVVGLLVAVLWR